MPYVPGLFLALVLGRTATLGVNSLQAFELLFAHGEMFTGLLKLGHLEVQSKEPQGAWTVLTQA